MTHQKFFVHNLLQKLGYEVH
ncbi:hypothetical protein BN873_p20057 [Candidatus Competibacter denitrificans Run_A_D11]|uniref:Uncharacterized protein n=1 Tax=Candidatus Competibacter denitrificans Run_A_D11 TaxID=1400863 RepID=W6MAB2_9GAMM|nr:hypothetical protein BN873_p20057 [Candidatus Competibacter denitrificans Run_A_D11]